MCGAIDTLKPRQNDRHVANDLDRLIFNSSSYLFMAWQISIFPWPNANIWFNRLLLNMDCEGAFVPSNEIVSHRHHNYKNKDQFIIVVIMVCVSLRIEFILRNTSLDSRISDLSRHRKEPGIPSSWKRKICTASQYWWKWFFFFFFFFGGGGGGGGGGGYLTKISWKGRGMAHCTMCCSDLNLMYQS